MRAGRGLVHVGRGDGAGLRNMALLLSDAGQLWLIGDATALEVRLRTFVPSSINRSTSSKFCTAHFDKFSTYGPSVGCSRTLRDPLLLLLGFSKSRTSVRKPKATK